MIEAEERKGPLWDFYRTLRSQGWELDTQSYSTCFRIKSKPNEDVASALSSLPVGARPQCTCALRAQSRYCKAVLSAAHAYHGSCIAHG